VTVAIAPVRGRVGQARRLAVAAALAAAATALIAAEADTRAAEAQLARLFVGAVAPGRAVASGAIVYFGIGTPEVMGLSITTMCSTTVLVVPLLLLAVAVVGITRARTARVGLGLLVGVGLAVSCNMIRFASAAWAYAAYGREGFDVVHRYIGSLFVIAGFVAAIVLLLRISLREPRRGRGTDAASRRRAGSASRRGADAPSRRRGDATPSHGIPDAAPSRRATRGGAATTVPAQAVASATAPARTRRRDIPVETTTTPAAVSSAPTPVVTADVPALAADGPAPVVGARRRDRRTGTPVAPPPPVAPLTPPPVSSEGIAADHAASAPLRRDLRSRSRKEPR